MSRIRFDNGPKATLTPHGFEWGPLEVIRAISGTQDDRPFVELALSTACGSWTFYVTSTGKVRVFGPNSEMGPANQRKRKTSLTTPQRAALLDAMRFLNCSDDYEAREKAIQDLAIAFRVKPPWERTRKPAKRGAR